MRVFKMRNYLCSALLLTAFIWLSAGTALGLTVNMVAEEASVTMPDLTTVPMWGLRDTADAGHGAGDWKVPVIKTNEATLTIALTNNLPDDTASTLKKPTSLIIPGLQATEAFAMVPTWTDGNTGSRLNASQRVRSLTHEAVSGGGTDSYSWNLKPGTYLIQSGSHQAVQVQMGLFAVLVVYPPGTTDQAYGPASTFTAEQTLVYSEVDTALHAAIAADNYGPGKAYTSTMDFNPDYYLINGQPYGPSSTPISLGSASNALLRFVNAGYETRVPVLQGQYVQLIAEDGNLLPYPQEVYSIELPAGKTKDALLVAAQSSLIAVYDSRFNMTNGGVSGGGLLTYLVAAAEGQLVSPNGGEVWTRGTTYEVSWVENPAADNYNLFYFDANNTPHFVANVAGGSYSWTVPLNAVAEAGKMFLLRAFSGQAPVGFDWSDQSFTIVPHMSPNGGEVLTAGQTYPLTWAPVAGASNYNLFYFDANNTPHFIANVVNANFYNWTVPLNATTGTGKRFRVTPFTGTVKIASGMQWSEGTFEIASALYPNGGEVFNIGQTYPLTWASVPGATNYNLFYFDADNTPHFIANVANANPYNWMVPLDAVVETGKRFRVTPFAGTTKISSGIQWSSGPFEIAPGLP